MTRIKPQLLAWHFVGDDRRLRDGRDLVVGEWLRHDGKLEMCASGLHASKRAIDALQYAPGSIITLCEIGGEIIRDTDKLVASARRPLFALNIEQELMEFARVCALDMLHLCNPQPDPVVREWLETGDPDLRSAARSAAWSAAWSAAAWSAAWSAARSAAWSAARSAA